MNETILMLLNIVHVLLTVVWLIIIAHAILSWLVAFNVINLHNDFVRSLWQALQRMTDPIYRPIRRVMPDFGALDLSPLVALVILYILDSIVLPWAAAMLTAPAVV